MSLFSDGKIIQKEEARRAEYFAAKPDVREEMRKAYYEQVQDELRLGRIAVQVELEIDPIIFE